MALGLSTGSHDLGGLMEALAKLIVILAILFGLDSLLAQMVAFMLA
jgi:hypothetical protein